MVTFSYENIQSVCQGLAKNSFKNVTIIYVKGYQHVVGHVEDEIASNKLIRL